MCEDVDLLNQNISILCKHPGVCLSVCRVCRVAGWLNGRLDLTRLVPSVFTNWIPRYDWDHLIIKKLATRDFMQGRVKSPLEMTRKEQKKKNEKPSCLLTDLNKLTNKIIWNSVCPPSNKYVCCFACRVMLVCSWHVFKGEYYYYYYYSEFNSFYIPFDYLTFEHIIVHNIQTYICKLYIIETVNKVILMREGPRRWWPPL